LFGLVFETEQLPKQRASKKSLETEEFTVNRSYLSSSLGLIRLRSLGRFRLQYFLVFFLFKQH